MKTALNQPVGTILLDIEGTTTPVPFVYQVLFPYARSHTAEFLAQYGSVPDIRQDLEALSQQYRSDMQAGLAPPALPNDDRPESLLGYIHWLIGRDSKCTALKSLQGKIWEEGYRTGRLLGQVFDDVPSSFAQWHEEKIHIGIFSSGSVLAQKLLFAHTTAGDLTQYLSAYFDTKVGTKTDPRSYERIALALKRAPDDIVFISDLTRELDAAKTTGMAALLCERPGNLPQPANTYRVIRSLAEVCAPTGKPPAALTR